MTVTCPHCNTPNATTPKVFHTSLVCFKCNRPFLQRLQKPSLKRVCVGYFKRINGVSYSNFSAVITKSKD